MVDITAWMETFLQTLEKTFGNRIWFVGLQGSYARGEQTAQSDIDVVVVLDELTSLDIQTYRAMLDDLPHRDKICGFLSGKQELVCWDTAELFQFCYDTVAIKGSLNAILALVDDAAVDRAIKTAACGIYHACVHNMLHENSEQILKGLYKSASFAVQAIVFRQKGVYIRRLTDLLEAADAAEKGIIEKFLMVKQGDVIDFSDASETLFEWSKKQILHEKSR